MAYRPGQPINVLLHNVLWGTFVCFTLKHCCSNCFSDSSNMARVTQHDVCGAGVGAPVQQKTHMHTPVIFVPWHGYSYHHKTPKHMAMTHSFHRWHALVYTLPSWLLHIHSHVHAHTCLMAVIAAVFTHHLSWSPSQLPPRGPLTSQQGSNWCVHCVCINQPPALIKYGCLVHCVGEW